MLFRRRLGLNCTEKLLRVAFRDPVPTDVDENLPNDNSELSSAGKEFTESFLSHYVTIALPLLPKEAQFSVKAYLTSQSNFAYLANNLGLQVIESNVFMLS